MCKYAFIMLSLLCNALPQEQEALRKEFDELLNAIAKPADKGLTKAEIKALKDAAFGPLTFWITEMRPIEVRFL